MMMSWYKNAFSITGPLWKEQRVTGGFLLKRASDELWCSFAVFFVAGLGKPMEQSVELPMTRDVEKLM